MFDVTDPMRLRAMIESWEQAGLVRRGLAAKALTAQPGAPDPAIQPSPWNRRVEILGYVGAIPFGLAGLLLARAGSGTGSLFLIGLLIAMASPQAARASTRRRVYIPLTSSSPMPRHRAARRFMTLRRGPKARENVLNGRYARQVPAITLVSSNSR